MRRFGGAYQCPSCGAWHYAQSLSMCVACHEEFCGACLVPAPADMMAAVTGPRLDLKFYTCAPCKDERRDP